MADSSYVIDIAANMPDAGVTTAQLDELSQSLIDAGASAETLELATIAVAAQLSAAKDATEAANAALAEGNARYGELERAAIKANKALDKAALSGNAEAHAEAVAEWRRAEAALDAEAVALKGLEGAAKEAAAAQKQLVSTQGNLNKLSRASAQSLSEQAAAERKAAKEAEGFVPAAKQWGDFTDAISTSEGRAILAAGAVLGLVTAVAAITAAALAGTVALAGYAVSLADTKREAELTTAAAETLAPGLVELRGDFAALSDETGASATDLRAWTKQLDQAKVKAEDLPAALRAVALADAALGKGQGVGEFLDRLKETQGAAGDVSAEFEALAPIVRKRMMGLSAQSAKLSKNFGDLFGGLDIEPVLEGFRILVDLFDKNTAAGQAMKFLFEEIFQPLIDQATNAAYVIEAFVLGFLIGLTKLYIELKPAIRAIGEFFGFEDTSLTDTLDMAKQAGELIAPVIAAITFAFLALVGAIGTVVGVMGAIAAAFIALPVYMNEAAQAVGNIFGNAIKLLISLVTGVPAQFSGFGADMMQGLANGITGAAGAVVAAVTGAAQGAINAARSALGIASPSKVFAEIGGYTAEGFAEGVDDGASKAQDAMAAMVEPPEAGSSSYSALGSTAAADASAKTGGAPAAGSRGGKPAVHIENLYLGGSKATKKDAEDLAEAITQLLEGDAASIAGEEADEDAA